MSDERQEISDFMASLKKNRDLSAFAQQSSKNTKGLNEQKKDSRNKKQNTGKTNIEAKNTISEAENMGIEPRTSIHLSNQFLNETQIPSKEVKGVKTTEIAYDKTKSNPFSKNSNKLSVPILDKDFIAYLQKAHEADLYAFQSGKRFLIDDQNHKVLMKLRYEYDLKSISVLVNTLISQFIERNSL